MTEGTPVIGGPHHGQLLPVEEWMRLGDCCARYIEEESRPMPRDIFEASPGAAAFRRFTYRLVQVGYGDAPAYQQLLVWVPASVEEGQEMTYILDLAATAPARPSTHDHASAWLAELQPSSRPRDIADALEAYEVKRWPSGKMPGRKG